MKVRMTPVSLSNGESWRVASAVYNPPTEMFIPRLERTLQDAKTGEMFFLRAVRRHYLPNDFVYPNDDVNNPLPRSYTLGGFDSWSDAEYYAYRTLRKIHEHTAEPLPDLFSAGQFIDHSLFSSLSGADDELTATCLDKLYYHVCHCIEHLWSVDCTDVETVAIGKFLSALHGSSPIENGGMFIIQYDDDTFGIESTRQIDKRFPVPWQYCGGSALVLMRDPLQAAVLEYHRKHGHTERASRKAQRIARLIRLGGNPTDALDDVQSQSDTE